ncbi:hypothetical protein SAMN06297229_1214 [Pseudidiomarina planktonica]|uniref:Lon N-terminal domain-containing protein n=1 Tax=Pseudidiomarina planktonica TaxID=1323738 RepID=A0A1Y6EY83_9GAMM|nr:LON peptidase substrate-binding domain-containing protein [Pseudidiomarina planktonica]RUO65385.1 peptidase S16 [Pseudidiomarina planktonica]SMQ65223.1 hypothetical protein SAMN06297229_1214 [Pseudidiomarina planktonica]
MSAVKRIPLFPLTSHVLPGGQIRLRIFEPRYLRMVKDAMRHGSEIGMCMLDAFGNKENNSHILPLGTLAKIVDFECLPDGLLGITVVGQSLFCIRSIDTEKDGLRVAEVEARQNWPQEQLCNEDSLLRHRMEEIYQQHPELKDLCPEHSTDRTDWLCLRWLEILPLDPSMKQELLDSKDCHKARDYIRNLIL